MDSESWKRLCGAKKPQAGVDVDAGRCCDYVVSVNNDEEKKIKIVVHIICYVDGGTHQHVFLSS